MSVQRHRSGEDESCADDDEDRQDDVDQYGKKDHRAWPLLFFAEGEFEDAAGEF